MTEKKKNVCLPKRLIASRKLIGNLAKNDFKKNFAVLIFGVIWAFIQPVITVLLYWFVFEFGLHQKVNDLRTGLRVFGTLADGHLCHGFTSGGLNENPVSWMNTVISLKKLYSRSMHSR